MKHKAKAAATMTKELRAVERLHERFVRGGDDLRRLQCKALLDMVGWCSGRRSEPPSVTYGNFVPPEYPDGR